MERDDHKNLLDFLEEYEQSFLDQQISSNDELPSTPLEKSKSHNEGHLDVEKSAEVMEYPIKSDVFKSADEELWRSEISLIESCSDLHSKEKLYWDTLTQELDTSQEDFYNTSIDLSSSLNAGYSGSFRKRKVSCYEDALRVLGLGMEGRPGSPSITKSVLIDTLSDPLPKSKNDDEPCELIDKLGSLKLSRISSISHSDPELHASPKLSSRIDHPHLLAPADILTSRSKEVETDAGLSKFIMRPKSPTHRKVSEPYIRGHIPETLELQFKQLMEGVITRAIESSSELVQGRENKDNSEGLAGLNRLVVMLEQLNQARKDNRYWRKRCRYLENKYSCPGTIGACSGKSPERTDLKDEELKRDREKMLYDYFQAKPLAKKKSSLATEMELKKIPSDSSKELKAIEMTLKDDKMERKKSKKFQTKWEQVKKVFWSARQEALAKKEITTEWTSSINKPDDKRLTKTERQRVLVGSLMLPEPQKVMPDDEDGEGNLDSPKSVNSEPVAESGAMAAEESNKIDESSTIKNRLSLSDFPSIDSYAESTAKLQDILNFQKQQQFAINYPDVLQHEKVGTIKTSSSPFPRATEQIFDDQKQVQFAFPDPQRTESNRLRKTDTASHLNVKHRDNSADHHFSDSDKYSSSSTYQLPLGKFSKSDKGQLDQSWDSANLKAFQQHLRPAAPGEESKIRSSGKVTWEKVKDLIHTRKGSFRRRRSKKQETYLDLIPQRSADAELNGKFPDMADIIRSEKGEVQSSKAADESIFRREFSSKLKKSNSKSKDTSAGDEKSKRKVSRSDENFATGLPNCGSSPGLTELTPMLSRSRSDKIRRDRSTSNEGGGATGAESSLTSPIRRRADTYTNRQAEKRQVTRAQPLKDQKNKIDSKTFSSKDSDDQDHHHHRQQSFELPPSSSKAPKPSNISLAEIYTCTSLSKTINVINLSASYRPPPSPFSRKDPSKSEDVVAPPDTNPPTSISGLGVSISQNSNLKVPMFHLALSTDSLQSTSSSGFTRTSSTLSTNTPGLSPSYRDDCPSGLSKGSSFSGIEVKDDSHDGVPIKQKERPKSALVESVECGMIDKENSTKPGFLSQPTDSSFDYQNDGRKANIQDEVGEAESDKNQVIKDTTAIMESLSANESLQRIQDSSSESSQHLSPADSDKAALLTRLVSASEILFRSIGESGAEKSKPTQGRKSFLLLQDLMERLINELKTKPEIPATPSDEYVKTVESCVTSSETEQEDSIKDLRSSSTQTTPTIETTTSMEKPMLIVDDVDNSSSIEDQKLMEKIQIMFKNLPKTRRFSDSVISSPKLLFHIPCTPHPSRENLSSDPSPLRTNIELSEFNNLIDPYGHFKPETLSSQPCTPLRKVPARQIPYIRLQSQYDNVFPDTFQLRPHSATNVEGDFFQFLGKENLHDNDMNIQTIGIQITKSSEQDLSSKELKRNDKNEKISDLVVQPFNTHHRTLSDSGISESVFYSYGSSRNQLSGQLSTDIVQIDSTLRLSSQEKTVLLPPGSKRITRLFVDALKDSPKLTIYTRISTSTSTIEPTMAVRTAMKTTDAQSHTYLISPLTPPTLRCSFDVSHKNGRSKSQDYGSKQSSGQSKLDINVVSSEIDTVESVKKLSHVSSTPYIGKPLSIYTESLNLLEKPNLFIASDQCGIGYLATLSEPLIYVDPSDGINTKVTLPSIYALNDPATVTPGKDESAPETTKPSSASDPLTHKSTNVPDSSMLSINSSEFFETRPTNDDQQSTIIDNEIEKDDHECSFSTLKTRRPISSDSEVPKRSGYPIDIDVTVDVNPTKPSLKSKVKSSGDLEKTQKTKITFTKTKPEKLQDERTRLSLKERFLSSPKFLRIKFCKTKPSRDSMVEQDEYEDKAEEAKVEKTTKDESKKKKRSRSVPSTSSNIFTRFFEREFFQRSRRFFRRNKNK